MSSANGVEANADTTPPPVDTRATVKISVTFDTRSAAVLTCKAVLVAAALPLVATVTVII